jgi:hypothetical protein
LNDISRLQSTLDASKKEISSLIKTKESLSSEITKARSGLLLFKVNDVILSALIDSSSDVEQNRERLSMLLVETDNVLKTNIGTKKKHYLVMPSSELDEAVSYMTGHPGSTVVRIIAASNVVLGEEIPAHFELFENKLIFKGGEIISVAEIDGKGSLPSIEQKIKEVLAGVNETAITKGMIPNPDGSVGNIQYSKIFEASKGIKARNKTVSLSVEAAKDTFSAGPLDINLKIPK